MEVDNGFKTALMGFNKKDVLACIDRMAAEQLAAAQEAEATCSRLQEEVGGLRAAKIALEHELAESTAALQTAVQSATEQGKRAEAAEGKAAALQEQLTHAENRANDFKRRLFTREEEAVVLRRDNTRLTETLRQKQQEMTEMERRTAAAAQQVEKAQAEAAGQVEKARAEAAQRVQATSAEAAQQVEKAQADAAQQVQKVQAEAAGQVEKAQAEAAQQVQKVQAEAAEQQRQAMREAEAAVLAGRRQNEAEAAAVRKQMAESAADLEENVARLKRDLAAVDARIAETTAALQRSSAALAIALQQAEERVQALSGPLRNFPQGSRSAATDGVPAETLSGQTGGPSVAARRSEAARRAANLSNSLLDTLARLLNEKK